MEVGLNSLDDNVQVSSVDIWLGIQLVIPACKTVLVHVIYYRGF